MDPTVQLLLAIATSLGFGGVVGAILKEFFDQRKRADAIALKLFDAKLRAYEALQPAFLKALEAHALEVNVLFVAAESPDSNSDETKRVSETLRAEAETAFQGLWSTERVHLHVLSSDVVSALTAYRQVRFEASASPKKMLERAPDIHQAIVRVNAAIRKDCRTDALEANTERMIAGAALKNAPQQPLPASGKKPESLPPGK